MVKIFGPLASHHASGRISAPKIFSSSLRNRHDRQAPPVPPPPSGGSLLFTDTTDACNAPTINHTNQYPGTLEAWFNPFVLKGFIAGTWFGSQISGTSLGLTATDFDDSAAFAGKLYPGKHTHSISINTWIHIAITWDVDLVTSWENGTNIGTNTGFNYGLSHHSGFHVGGQYQASANYIHAYITRVRFSDIIRYTTNFTPAADFTTDANTISLWRMTEGSGTTVADESGNSHTLNFPAANLPTWSTLVP